MGVDVAGPHAKSYTSIVFPPNMPEAMKNKIIRELRPAIAITRGNLRSPILSLKEFQKGVTKNDAHGGRHRGGSVGED